MIHRDGDEAAIADHVEEHFQPGWHRHLAEAQSKIDQLSGASPWPVDGPQNGRRSGRPRPLRAIAFLPPLRRSFAREGRAPSRRIVAEEFSGGESWPGNAG